MKEAAALLWFIFGLAAPAPILPFAMYPEMGWLWGILLGLMATVVWLLPPYLVFVKGK